MTEIKNKIKRRIEGMVVSSKMKKTVVVEVERPKFNPKYERYFRRHRRFKAHDETNQYQVGDRVIIEETRPLSKEKKWIVVGKIM